MKSDASGRSGRTRDDSDSRRVGCRQRPGSRARFFELIVDAPGGETTIRCVKRCHLACVERGINPKATPMPTFTYQCIGSLRCSSARVGGWLNP